MKKRFGYLIMVLATSLFAYACSDDDDAKTEMEIEQPTMNIVETALETDILSSLVAALTKADENADSDLIGTLSGNGPFTVFAPSNDAFAALLAQLDDYDTLEDFDTDESREVLATILKYHVVAGVAATSGTLSNGQEIETVQGEKVTITINGGVFIGDASDSDAEVVLADVATSNGVVHVISKVLLPQAIIDALNTEEPGTLVDVVVAAEALSLLEAAVIKADLVTTLSAEGPFTVFAPTDDAFVALLDVLGDDYNSLDDFDTEGEIQLLKDILLYHVIAGSSVMAADLSAGEVPTALENNSIEVIASGETFVLGDASDVDANISATDIMASNGVAHLIDKVLLPQSAIDFVVSLSLKNIVEIAVETDDLSVLVSALQYVDAGLVELLGGDGPFTVFAPTNQAFVDLLAALGDDYNALADFDTQAEIDLLTNILKYHVVVGTSAFSTDLSDGMSIETALMESVMVNLTGGVFIQDATDTDAAVVIPDVEASNGVVHVVDKVLLPQEAVDFAASLGAKNIVEIASETADLSSLVAALVQADAGLVELLGGDGPFTVFAPTNQAFADLLDALGSEYNSLADFDTVAEKALLANILQYHVVASAAVFSSQLSDGQNITMAQNGVVIVDINNGVFLQDEQHNTNAQVITPDIEASNGVVHLVDKVLLPM